MAIPLVIDNPWPREPVLNSTPGTFDGRHSNEPANEGQPASYRLTSLGPSLAFDSFGTGGYLTYDPTNGLVSSGDIFSLGSGAKAE